MQFTPRTGKLFLASAQISLPRGRASPTLFRADSLAANLTHIIAVPYDSGRRNDRMGAGPLRLLDAGLVDRLATAGLGADVSIVESSSTVWPTEIATAFDLARHVAARVRAALSQGAFPLVLSGNCLPAALGAVSGATDVARVLWFDAHGDFNTPETTVTGFLDGMALATLTGRCWRGLTATIDGFSIVPEAAVALVGARDLDALEAHALSASQIVRVNVDSLVETTAPSLTRNGGTYLHLDVDVLDPSACRMNGYAVPGGITHLQLREAIRAIARRAPLRVASVTAFDPAADVSGSSLEVALSVCADLALARKDHLTPD